MANLTVNIVYVLILVALIVFIDFTYLRHEFWERLIVNILIVLVFVAFYYLFLFNYKNWSRNIIVPWIDALLQ